MFARFPADVKVTGLPVSKSGGDFIVCDTQYATRADLILYNANLQIKTILISQLIVFLSHKIFVPQSTSTSSDAQQSQMEREQTSEDDDDDEDDEDRGEQEVLIKQEPSIETYDMDEDAPRDNRNNDVKQPLKRYRLNRPLVKRKLIKENNSLDSRLLETLRLLRKSDLSRKKDECDSFGEYIAVSLRKHDERTQSMIKQAINNILFEQEMKKYSTGHYTVVLQGVDENPLVLGDQEEK